MTHPSDELHARLWAMIEQNIRPADIAQQIVQSLTVVRGEMVDHLAQLHPDDDAVQRLLFLHPDADLDLLAACLERIAAAPAGAMRQRQSRMLGEVHNRLLDILPHPRARAALVAAVGQAGERASVLQLLSFVEDPTEAATLIAALAPNGEGKARAEVARRWPEQVPPDVYAVLLSSPSQAFRLWLIERARTALTPTPPRQPALPRR